MRLDDSTPASIKKMLQPSEENGAIGEVSLETPYGVGRVILKVDIF